MTPAGRDTPPVDSTSIVDLRSPELYGRDRARGAVRLSLEDMAERAYLLPPRSRPLVVIAESPDDAQRARDILERAERRVRVFVEPAWREAFPVERGAPSRTALWEPAAIVVQALREHASLLPGRRALDIACGTGRNAVFLAQSGFEVTGIDRLADALERAQDLARRSGVTLRTLERDLEVPGALDGLRADCVVVVRYLERALFPALMDCLVPGGLLVVETFTVEQKRLGHPRNPLFLLQPGELRQAFASWKVLFHDEDWHDGAHTAQLVARKP